VAAGLEREAGAPARALELAEEAIQQAQPLGLATCEMWAGTEAGLARMDLGELDQAEAELRQAELLEARAHQGWIATEQVHLAYARILERLGKTDQAEEQRRLAETILQAKADRIQDPAQRCTYLAMSQPTH
jgi:tetratricopeptide (TPR) repeat protein